MQNGNLSFINNSQNKNDRKKAKKRKFSTEDKTLLDNSSKIFKPNPESSSEKHLFFTPAKNDSSSVLHYKNTKEYTQVIANPKSLQSVPKIFQTNFPKNKIHNQSNNFIFNLLTVKSFNTSINERFTHHEFSDENKKEKQKKKRKKPKKEKTSGVKLQRNIVNKEKQEKKKNKKKEHKEIMNTPGECHAEDNDGSCEVVIPSQVDMYKAIQEKALIFVMHHPSIFSFHGEIKITIITGEVEILGYTLSKNSVEVYSPEYCTPLTVQTKQPKQTTTQEQIESKIKHLLTGEDCELLLKKLKSDDSVILVEQIISTFGIVINKYFDMPLFPKDLEDVSSTNKTLKSLQSTINFRLSNKEKYFRKSPKWDKISFVQCTVLCGGKGVGKSTLLKYYMNRFVTLGEKVLCLDFDPGQTEFTYPGCVSAVVVDEPLLGPNFTHVKDPVVMMYFGDVDVCHNPLKYLECVKYIIDTCRKNEELRKMKWFVNTMGFCKGLGVNLMITIIKLLQPNTVIQIKSSDTKNNYPFYLTSVAVNSKVGFNWSMPLDDVNLIYDLWVIFSCAEYKNKQFQGGLKQRQLRDLMAISYFSKIVSPPFYNFNAVQPYIISFSKLYLGVDFLIDPNDVLKAFNGNIVSLSHFEPEDEEILSVESEINAYFKIVVKPKATPALGMGFVRGIHCQEKKIYVLTHLPMEIMESINCLSLGRVSPPHSMFLKQETAEGPTVYTTQGTVNTIHRVKRMFRILGTPHKN